MSTITINTDRKFSATAVPNLFIDRFMPAANGSYVKVYLYLLRCLSGSDRPFSLSSAAEQLDETERDILRALSYWEKKQVLSLTKHEELLTGITMLDLSTAPFENISIEATLSHAISIDQRSAKEKRNLEKVAPAAEDLLYTQPTYTGKELNALLKDEEVSWLLTIVEAYLERLLTPQDINLVVYLHDKLHFSKELILHLYEYCIEKGKKDAKYIETVAISWHKEDIDTVEKAQQNNLLYDAGFAAVNKAFSLGRTPGNKEREFIKRWNGMKFSPEMIEEACNRTLLQISKPDFKYADKILTNWHEKGISTLADVSKEDKRFSSEKSSGTAKTTRKAVSAPVTKSAGAYNSYPQRQYSTEDMLELERKLLHQ